MTWNLRSMWVVCALLVVGSSARGGQVVAIADADAIVSAVTPNANFGTIGSLRVGLTPIDQPNVPHDPHPREGAQRALLHFDLSGIPAQAQITGVTLRAFQVDQVIGQGFNVFEVQQAWDEAAVNWSTRPRTGDALGTWRLTGSSFVSFINANLTALVEAWVRGAKANHGIELRFHDEVSPLGALFGQRADTLGSRETPLEAQRPRLIVDYVIPEPATLALLACASPWIMRRKRR